jgi:hypothetical protein
MKFKEELAGTYRVKMRGKIMHTDDDEMVAYLWKVDLDHESYQDGKEARAIGEYHNGYRWEKFDW